MSKNSGKMHPKSLPPTWTSQVHENRQWERISQHNAKQRTVQTMEGWTPIHSSISPTDNWSGQVNKQEIERYNWKVDDRVGGGVWIKYLDTAVYAFIYTMQSSTGLSPFYLKEHRNPIPKSQLEDGSIFSTITIQRYSSSRLVSNTSSNTTKDKNNPSPLITLTYSGKTWAILHVGMKYNGIIYGVERGKIHAQKRSIFTVTDYFTKWVEAFIIKRKKQQNELQNAS